MSANAAAAANAAANSPDSLGYDAASFTGIGVENASLMDPSGMEGKSGFTASGAEGMGQPEAPSPESGGPMALSDALAIGLDKAYEKDKGLMTATAVVPGMSFLGLAAALDNAPPGSLAGSPADAPGDPDGGDDSYDVPPPPDPEPEIVAPLPEVVDTSGETVPDLVKAESAEPEAPMVTPKPATAAPGTLLRQRRRSRTILTTPAGVLGGYTSSPARRTRSLPRKSLLGG
jgi:hypothetical protein